MKTLFTVPWNALLKPLGLKVVFFHSGQLRFCSLHLARLSSIYKWLLKVSNFCSDNFFLPLCVLAHYRKKEHLSKRVILFAITLQKLQPFVFVLSSSKGGRKMVSVISICCDQMSGTGRRSNLPLLDKNNNNKSKLNRPV